MESLISATLSNSLLAAALAVVALAFSRLLKNKPAVAHVLWLLVLVKLVTPPVFSVPGTLCRVQLPVASGYGGMCNSNFFPIWCQISGAVLFLLVEVQDEPST